MHITDTYVIFYMFLVVVCNEKHFSVPNSPRLSVYDFTGIYSRAFTLKITYKSVFRRAHTGCNKEDLVENGPIPPARL